MVVYKDKQKVLKGHTYYNDSSGERTFDSVGKERGHCPSSTAFHCDGRNGVPVYDTQSWSHCLKVNIILKITT